MVQMASAAGIALIIVVAHIKATFVLPLTLNTILEVHVPMQFCSGECRREREKKMYQRSDL